MLQMTTVFTRRNNELIRETQTRLYEMDGGIEALNESELLHLLLGPGTKNHSLEEMVNEILALKSEYCLKGLNSSYLISKVSGLTKKKAEMLIAALELGKRVYTQEPTIGQTIRSPEDAANILMYMKHHTQEHFVALFLNTKNVVIGKKNNICR